MLSGCIASSVMAQLSPTGETVPLKFKSYQKWDIVLPQEKFAPVAGKIPVAHAGGDGFLVEVDGTSLSVDANGDGKVGDVKAKGTAGLVKLEGKTADGKTIQYAARLANNGGWTYSTACAMVGSLQGETIRLIDQNGNGRYNDFGEDAMVVGNGDAAAFLSRVVSVKEQLFTIEVTELGDEITARPYEGQAGILNLAEKFETDGKLTAAVVKSTDGQNSFELSRAAKGLAVPAGQYEIASGLVEKGKETVRIRKGNSRPITVAQGQTSVLPWGGPLVAKFEFDRAGDKVTFAPEKLWFYGRSGEEYHTWVPDGKPPKFVIADAKSGKEIAEAKFGGC
jgi:hypothetical protein